MIQHIYNNQEYITRYRLAEKYHLSKTGGVVQRVLAKDGLTILQERNQFYYLKNEIEALLEAELNKK